MKMAIFDMFSVFDIFGVRVIDEYKIFYTERILWQFLPHLVW